MQNFRCLEEEDLQPTSLKVGSPILYFPFKKLHFLLLSPIFLEVTDMSVVSWVVFFTSLTRLLPRFCVVGRF